MTELEDAIREALRYDAERAVRDDDVERLLTPARRRRSGGVARVLAAAAAVVVVAAASFGLAYRHIPPQRSPSSPPAATAKIGGLVFTLPHGGRFVGVTFLTGAVDQPVGWIINQDPAPECETHGTSGTCHGPYTSLSAGQYAVSFAAGPDFGEFRATTTIAGLPAAEGSTNGECQHGFKASIETARYRSYPKTEPKGSLLIVTACFGSDDPGLLQTIKVMITNAHR